MLPRLSVPVYPIVEHDRTPERSIARAQVRRQAIDEDVPDTAGGGSASEIGQAK